MFNPIVIDLSTFLLDISLNVIGQFWRPVVIRLNFLEKDINPNYKNGRAEWRKNNTLGTYPG